MDLDKAVKKIKSLEIQGASNVAREAVLALAHYSKYSSQKSPKAFFANLVIAKERLFATRPTEPAMRNMLDYIIFKVAEAGNDIGIMRKVLENEVDNVISSFEVAKKILVSNGVKVIPKGGRIYTHCHSHNVIAVIKAAKDKGIRVNNTETRPRFQGRLTAMDLSSAGIPVSHFVDSAVVHALQCSDVMLIGADAITPSGVCNKVGSGLFAKVAHDMKIPVYVCSTSWKVDPQTFKGKKEVIEEREGSEVWDRLPKGVSVVNPAFDVVSPKHITGVISELGVMPYGRFITAVRKEKSWMFHR